MAYRRVHRDYSPVPDLDRRRFLSVSARSAGSLAGFAALQNLLTACAGSGRRVAPRVVAAGPRDGGYGALVPAGPELALPHDFAYRVIGVEGTMMSDGHPTPMAHDGMAAFPLPNGNIRLIRNHEVDERPTRATVIGDPATAYDLRAGGGTTSLEIDPVTREIVRDFVSLNGTLVNCAGGPTPWGSWLSCEEKTYGPTRGRDRPHGYVFEVPVLAERAVPAVPLTAMGRFEHEAVAVDPATGIVYETEDEPRSGFYRFIPDEPYRPGRPANLAAGGRLQVLGIAGSPGYDARRGQVPGRALPTVWIDIPDPDPAVAERDQGAVLASGMERGAAVFDRLEGCWYADGKIFFDATEGGDSALGQIWEYRPASGRDGELLLLFESGDASVLKGPDNICVSPRGGIVVCEDHGGACHMRGLTPDGRLFDFGVNLLNNREFAGATYSPDGRTLFVNIQGDLRSGGPGNLGMTLAIWGPWERGVL